MGSGILFERCGEEREGLAQRRRDAEEVEEGRKRRTRESEGRDCFDRKRLVGIDETRRGHWSADETDRCGARGLEAKEGEKKMEEKKIVNCQLLGQRRWRARLGGEETGLVLSACSLV